MKKKNLNFLLALLAALALVFAGACSDGSDDDSSGGTPTDSTVNPSDNPEGTVDISVAGETYEYTGVTHSEVTTSLGSNKVNTLDSVTLAFDDTNATVSVTVAYTVCAYSTDHNSCSTSASKSFTAAYSVSGSVVSVTLPKDEGGTTVGAANESAVTLGLTQQNDGSLLVTAGSSYTVKDTDNDTGSDGIDLFVETENAGGLKVDTSKFTLDDESNGEGGGGST